MNKLFVRIGSVLVLLLLLTALIWLTDADLRLARFIFEDHFIFEEKIRWPGWRKYPWDIIYGYAALPAVIMAGSSLLILVAGVVVKPLAIHRRQALFLVLFLVIGPGLLVNVLFKDNYGRARPQELVEFGGEYEFTEIWTRGDAGRNSSFPSGHSAIGFYMIAPWFLLRRQKRNKGLVWLAGGLGYGSLVGTARILQGGHFISDVLWAGGFVYITGELLVFLILPDDSPPETV